MGTRTLRKWLKVRKDVAQSPPSTPDCVTSVTDVEPTNSGLALAAPAISLLEQGVSVLFPEANPLTTRTPRAVEDSRQSSLPPETAKRQNTHGLLPLHPSQRPLPNPNSNTYPIDIIAVHGITGDAYTTFKHKSGFFWLRDALPNEFPGARIYSYGYEADVFGSRGKGGFDEFAGTLLEDLKRVRKSPEDQRRPIIFICHSMGGIVVKEALNSAHVESPRFDNILASVHAILFLAVPHRGANAAAFASTLTGIANLALKGTGISRLTGGARSDLVQSLSRGSPRALKILKDFRKYTGRIKIYSFSEQDTIFGLNRKVVDAWSASMGHDGEVLIEMPGCDHQSICRFENEESMPYQRVLGILQEAVSDITSRMTAELFAEDHACLHTLSFPSMTSRLSELNSQLHALPQTCTWILRHPSFNGWNSQTLRRSSTTTSGTQILYIKGHPGTGKSTLMSFIHNFYLQQPLQYNQILLSFFFHGNGSLIQKSREGMLRSMLVQLYKQNLSARRSILSAVNEKRQGHDFAEDVSWSLDELQSLFVQTVGSQAMRDIEVVILIDALDEAIDEGGSKAVNPLLAFFHQLSGTVGFNTRICISCREYPVVAVGVSGLQISIQDSNRQDIERYVSYKLRTAVDGWELQDENVRKSLETAIVHKADGVFLWVVKRMEIIVDELNDGTSSFADVQRLVGQESNELSALYQSILQREVKESVREKAVLFLQWVCLAERPLNLTEMRIAIACDERYMRNGQQKIEESENFVEENETMQRLTKSLSGGLAEVKYCADGSTIQLIHQTVNDFLREGGLEFLFSEFGDSKAPSMTNDEALGRSETRLSRSCFNYLKLREIEEFSMTYGIAPVPTAHDVEGRFPFIRYAVMFCFLHAQRSELYGKYQEDLAAFVDHSAAIAVFQISDNDEIQVSDCAPSIFEIWKVLFEATRRLHEHHLQSGLQLIHTAAKYNLQSTVRYLVETRNQIELKDGRRQTPLCHAVRGGHVDLVRWLLDSGANIEAEDMNMRTPLELAVTSRHDQVTKLLLERGADANKKTGRFSNILEAACNASQRVELVESLIERGAQIDGDGGTLETGRTALEEAAYTGDIETVRVLISQGANVHALSEYHGSALQAAVQGISPQTRAVVELLLQNGASVNATSGHYGNALQAAARYSSPDVVKLLLQNGAAIDAQGGYYGSTLQAACANIGYDEDIVEILLSHGADVNAESGYYGSALHSAAASGNPAIFQRLLSKGAKADLKGGIHQNMIEAAGAGGSREIFQYLLGSGADINAQGGRYGTALQAAVFYTSESFVEFLLENGADVNLQGGRFGNALCAAVEVQGENMIKLLLKKGADVHACSPEYCSALQLAVKKGNARQMKVLLEHGNDINAQMSGMIRFFRT